VNERTLCLIYKQVCVVAVCNNPRHLVGSTKKSFVGAVRGQNLAAWERGFESYWNVYG